MGKKKKKDECLSSLDRKCFDECITEYIDITTRIDNHSPVTLSGQRVTSPDWKADFDLATKKAKKSSELFRRLLAGETPVDGNGFPLFDANLVRGTVALLKRRKLWPIGSYFINSKARKKKLTLSLPKKATVRVFHTPETGVRRFDETGAPLVRTYVPDQVDVPVQEPEIPVHEQQMQAEDFIDLSTVDTSAFDRQDQQV